jgi:FKBP-type peptidyl-prolyl cis-trans isomerase
MSKKFAESMSTPVFIEPLEQRELLAANPVSHTTLHLTPGKTPLGKDITMSIVVTGTKGQALTGTAEITLDGKDVGGLTLTNGKVTYNFGPGNFPALYVGKHTFLATYQGNGAGLPASESKTVTETIVAPKLKKTADGLMIAVVKKGTGNAVTATGKTANVLYSGFLTNGTLFDASYQHPPITPLPVAIGQPGIIQGFQEGVTGMKVGEERLLVIPPNLGYGNQANGNIPANSTLVFLIRLISIS